MTEQDQQTISSDSEKVKKWANQNFKAVQQQLADVKQEMRNSKPRENINVRRVDSDDLEGRDNDQIIVEHKVERWFDINYFKKMLEESDTSTSDLDIDDDVEGSDEDVLFGDEDEEEEE